MLTATKTCRQSSFELANRWHSTSWKSRLEYKWTLSGFQINSVCAWVEQMLNHSSSLYVGNVELVVPSATRCPYSYLSMKAAQLLSYDVFSGFHIYFQPIIYSLQPWSLSQQRQTSHRSVWTSRSARVRLTSYHIVRQDDHRQTNHQTQANVTTTTFFKIILLFGGCWLKCPVTHVYILNFSVKCQWVVVVLAG